MRSMMRFTLAAALLLTLLPARAAAQFEFLDMGVYGAYASEAFDGSKGLGVLASVDLPVLPVTVRGTAERYFPDCGAADGCSTWAWGADVLVRFPLPAVRPYVVGGIAHRFLDPSDAADGLEESGVALGVGLDVSLAGLRAFGEARRELVDLPKDQWVLRLGLYF